jgi:hypothetical protein
MVANAKIENRDVERVVTDTEEIVVLELTRPEAEYLRALTGAAPHDGAANSTIYDALGGPGIYGKWSNTGQLVIQRAEESGW